MLCNHQDPCSEESLTTEYSEASIDIFQNIVCELAREPFYDALNETEQALLFPYLRLAGAKANHSLAVTLLAAATAKKNLIEEESGVPWMIVKVNLFVVCNKLAFNLQSIPKCLDSQYPSLSFNCDVLANKTTFCAYIGFYHSLYTTKEVYFNVSYYPMFHSACNINNPKVLYTTSMQ